MSKFISVILVTLLTSMAQAAFIETAIYNGANQTLELSLVYRGGLKQHNFSLAWDLCKTINGVQQTSARLIDSGWDDRGTNEVRQAVSLDLSGNLCKPAELTIFSGKHSRATVWVH